jgi:hypothetical protein
MRAMSAHARAAPDGSTPYSSTSTCSSTSTTLGSMQSAKIRWCRRPPRGRRWRAPCSGSGGAHHGRRRELGPLRRASTSRCALRRRWFVDHCRPAPDVNRCLAPRDPLEDAADGIAHEIDLGGPVAEDRRLVRPRANGDVRDAPVCAPEPPPGAAAGGAGARPSLGRHRDGSDARTVARWSAGTCSSTAAADVLSGSVMTPDRAFAVPVLRRCARCWECLGSGCARRGASRKRDGCDLKSVTPRPYWAWLLTDQPPLTLDPHEAT